MPRRLVLGKLDRLRPVSCGFPKGICRHKEEWLLSLGTTCAAGLYSIGAVRTSLEIFLWSRLEELLDNWLVDITDD